MSQDIAGASIPEAHAGSEARPALSLPFAWLEGDTALLDPEGGIVAIGDSLAAWLGGAPAQLPGQSFWDRMAGLSPGWEVAIQELRGGTEPLSRRRLEMGTSEDAGHFQIEVARNSAGAFVRVCSVLPPDQRTVEPDLEQRMRADGAWRELMIRSLRAEAQLASVMQRWPGVIFTQRADFSFYFASPKIEELTGVSVQEWRAHPQRFWQVVHEADIDDLERHVKRCVEEKTGLSTTFRVRHAKTGRVVYLLEHRQAMVSGNGLVLGYEGVWLDVTRQVIAEKRLSTAAWKETLAVLTMGLAHDFSNIMAGILSLSESFLAQVDQDHPFWEGLTLIRRNSLQAHQLVHRIINLHHGKTGANHYCDLNELMADTVDLVRKVLPRRIELKTDWASEPLPLYTDSVELRQVVINLTLNAAEAMPQRGELTLRTARLDQLPELKVMRGALPRLPAACLSVSDTGCGIKSRHLNSVFDPFFTTKPMNKGSGLGLYNTRLFVERNHGAVSVESTEGLGTTFSVWLPQADFTEAERGLTQASRRRRSLLLVGQADATLDSTAEFLRCHGYHVVATTSENYATDLLESGDHQFAAVMVVMEPKDETGRAVIAEVRRRNLPIKTVVQLAGCHPDEIETSVLQKADVLIPPDLPETEIMERLDHNLPDPVYEPAPAL